MSDTASRRSDEQEAGSWWDAEVDGRSVRFWIAVGVAIATVTLGLGAWWVWGMDRATSITGGGMDGQAGSEMAGMASTDVRLPPVAGLYEGERIFFAHPEASDPDVAGMLTDMMSGSPVLVVPALADVPPSALDEVYVFTDGIEGDGPFGFQADVFPSVPGDDEYRPLRGVVLVSWAEGAQPRALRSAGEVLDAAEAGEVTLEETGVVVNMPIVVWPGGQR